LSEGPPNGQELARLLIKKAAGDEIALRRLSDDDDVPDDVLGFHAQQAVEKMMKAVLALNGVAFERTHNLMYLITLIDNAGIERPAHTERLPELTPWATEFRYAELPTAALHRQDALALVAQTRSWAEAQLARREAADKK
jgi:HEPN domain-containing protein